MLQNYTKLEILCVTRDLDEKLTRRFPTKDYSSEIFRALLIMARLLTLSIIAKKKILLFYLEVQLWI